MSDVDLMKTVRYADLKDWEVVAKDTYRLTVEGGWLYRYQVRHSHEQTVPAMVFVPR